MGRGSESNACQARSTPRDVARMMTQIQKEICKLKTIKETRKRCSNRSRCNHTLSGGCLHKYPIHPSSSSSSSTSTSCAAFIMQPAPSHPLGLNRFFSYFNDASSVPWNHPKVSATTAVIQSSTHSFTQSVSQWESRSQQQRQRHWQPTHPVTESFVLCPVRPLPLQRARLATSDKIRPSQ